MKQRITTAGVICLLIFLLKFPEESLFAARDGMKLWLNTLIPTLLPFLILTGILLHTKGLEKTSGTDSLRCLRLPPWHSLRIPYGCKTYL